MIISDSQASLSKLLLNISTILMRPSLISKKPELTEKLVTILRKILGTPGAQDLWNMLPADNQSFMKAKGYIG